MKPLGLEVDRIKKSYGDSAIINDISLAVLEDAGCWMLEKSEA